MIIIKLRCYDSHIHIYVMQQTLPEKITYGILLAVVFKCTGHYIIFDELLIIFITNMFNNEFTE